MSKHHNVPSVHELVGAPFLTVTRPLACAIGLNEALFLQRVYFWMKYNEEHNQNYHEGRWWSYNTYERWQEDFPFWSNATIRRIVNNLRASGVLITCKLAPDIRNHTLWYTIDFEVLEKLMEGVDAIPQYPEASHTTQSHSVKLTTSCAQGEHNLDVLKVSKSSDIAVKTAVETFRTSSADADKIMSELNTFLKGASVEI